VGNAYQDIMLSQAHYLASGNALTDFFFRDVGIKQNQFNVGQQLLSAGIVILEVRTPCTPNTSSIADSKR
jgi:hypothetical protein